MIDDHTDCGCGDDCNGEECGDDCQKTKKHCPCDVCDGKDSLADMLAQEQTMMEKQGWYAHCVAKGDTTPSGFNYHTHGFEESFNVPDIQFVLPIDPKILHGLAHDLVKQIKEGLKITDGMLFDKLIRKYKVRFVKATECDREVLRIILPDKNGCLTADAEGMFGEQYKDL